MAYLPTEAAQQQQQQQLSTEAAFARLQNGSDIRGVALARTPTEEITLTPAAAFFIASSFVDFLRRQEGLKPSESKTLTVAVGSDPRVSGPLLRSAVFSGLLCGAPGVYVHDAKISTTPAMFYSLVAPGSEVVGSIMLTASHMPMHNNGLKFFTRQGGLEKKDIKEILEGAAAKCKAAGVKLGDPTSDTAYVLEKALHVDNQPKEVPLLREYAQHMQEVIKKGVNHPEHPDQPLKGFKIVVDAGNGSGGFFADQVLAPLGADVSGSQFLDPDGTFPNHIPNPENKEAMESAVAAVKAAGADLGIVFDTDVDRSGIVDGSGMEINSNRYIALMSTIVLKDYPGTTIVTDSVTSNGLTEFIEKLGGKHCRYKRGYKNVISKGVELNNSGTDCQLMMETSGHGALADNWFLDDGAQLAVKAVIQMVRSKLEGKGSLSDLLAELKEPAESVERRIKIKATDFKTTGSDVLTAFQEWVTSGSCGQSNWSLEPVNHEGVRISVEEEGEGKRGWLLLRQSLHDPLLVLNMESDTKGGVAGMQQLVADYLQKNYGKDLDLTTLA